jgi:penicillin-binding protein 1C
MHPGKTSGLVAAVAIGGLLVGALLTLYHPISEQARPPDAGARILDRHGRLLYQVVDPRRGATRPVPLGAVAPALKLATIAAEDASFYANPGVDPFALGRALLQNLRSGDIVAGGSTITQQLARLRHLPPEERVSRTLARKVHEVWLALHLTATLGKDGVLEQYLNSAPYGNLTVGAEAAARTYFGKPARDLSLAEAALLAGLPQAPADYDPFLHPEVARARQHIVLDLMARHRFVTPEAAAAARAEPLQLNPRPFPITAPHFVEYVRSLLEAEFRPEQLHRGGLTVWTTLDLELQESAERAARRHLAGLAEHQVTNSAVVALDPRTGEVLAMVGSADYFDPAIAGQINLALATRQPGSAFKPITYAAALESGRYSPATFILDQRAVFRTRRGEPYEPENYDRRFHGSVPLRVALASSFNVPAVRVLADLGLERVLALARDLGLRTLADPDRYDLSLTLGGGEVRLLDLAAAYAAFAAGGVYHEPAAILRVEDAEGRPLRVWSPEAGRQVLSPQTAWLITDILADDAARAPGFGRDGVLNLGRPAAVKTGTTSDYRDNWTLGYTPDLVVGVWVGNADYRPMRDVSGVTGAAPLWRDVLAAALEGRPLARFARPDGFVQVELCANSEQPAGPWCPARRWEWLVPRVREGPSGRPGPSPTLPLAPSPAPPLVRLTSPNPGAVVVIDPAVPGPAQHLPVEAATTFPASRVELFANGEVLASKGAPPYLAGWPLAPGRHEFWAIAVDPSGARGESERVSIEVVEP